MSNIIQLLPDHIANQIAAGEVIQRPSSVVKELMENAIDADASQIQVIIKDAGKTLIKVVDNGKGMTAKDAELCFARHATSKVRKADDLFALSTKGFRGEALASIAAIAHVVLKTKQQESETGTEIAIEGSKLKRSEEIITPNGSIFEIKNLFYNVPARRNFLKAESTEFNHISEEFIRIAIAHPDITLTLTHNDKVIYQLSDAVLRKRIVDLLGKNMNDKLVPIEEETNIVKLNGFVLKPEAAKKRRGEQYFFVNNRFFKSPYFNHAVNKAYEGLIASDQFPSYFLFIDVDTSKIDVNVHPTKTEIKFEEEKSIYTILRSSIKQALGKYNIAPTLDFDRETSFDLPADMRNQPTIEPEIRIDPTYNPFNKSYSDNSRNDRIKTSDSYSPGIQNQGFGQKQAKPEDWANFYTISEDETEEESQGTIELEANDSLQSFIIKNNFLIKPSKSGLMLVHIRRAIERINYDRIMSKFIAAPIDSQKLLFPVEIEVSKTDITNWKENEILLKQLGYQGSVENDLLVISSAPSLLQEEAIIKSMQEILEKLAFETIDKGDIAHNVVCTIAYSSSTGNIKLSSTEEVNNLFSELFQCSEHSYSPRGKKILETINTNDLVKLLG